MCPFRVERARVIDDDLGRAVRPEPVFDMHAERSSERKDIVHAIFSMSESVRDRT